MATARALTSTPLLVLSAKPTMNIRYSESFHPRFPSTDFWVFQNSSVVATPDLGLREGEAARLAVEELEKLKGSDAHRLSLVPTAHSLSQLKSLFENLDKYLFRDVLKKNVSLRFSSNLPSSMHGSTSALGVFDNQIVITLNSELTRHPSHLPLVASLIHHMSHAYLLVCCGYGDSNGNDGRHNLKHGLAFSSIVHTIQDLLVDEARIPLADLFYCSTLISRSTYLPRYLPGRMSLHSSCYFNASDHENKNACSVYMRQVTAAALASNLEPPTISTLPAANISQSLGSLGGLMNR